MRKIRKLVALRPLLMLINRKAWLHVVANPCSKHVRILARWVDAADNAHPAPAPPLIQLPISTAYGGGRS